MKCQFCGAEVRGRYCEYCDSENLNWREPRIYYYGRLVSYDHTVGAYYQPVSDRKNVIALVLCGFAGIFGLHCFYVRKYGMGILYLCTGGLFLIGMIIDLIQILGGTYTDADGMLLNNEKITLTRKTLYLILMIFFGFAAFITYSPDAIDTTLFYLFPTAVFGILWYREKRKMHL